MAPIDKPAQNSLHVHSGHLSAGRIFTASWRSAIGAEPQVQPIRISIGRPKWIAPAKAAAYTAIEPLMPWGLLNADLPWEEFETRYRAALERRAQRIECAVASLLDLADRPAALCCFEADPARCHRSIAAGFLRDRLGLEVPEWAPPR